MQTHVLAADAKKNDGLMVRCVSLIKVLVFASLLVFVGFIVSVNGPNAGLLIKAAIGNVGLFVSMLVMRQRLNRCWLHVDFVRSMKV